MNKDMKDGFKLYRDLLRKEILVGCNGKRKKGPKSSGRLPVGRPFLTL